MTDENIRRNVADGLALARSALRAAAALCDLGIAPDAASRAYYAALHAARALLFSIGLDATSHRAVRSLVARHFVQSGRLEAARSKDLAQLEALRTASDHDTTFALGVDDIRPEIDKARLFLDVVSALLVKDGLVEPPDA
ncbi:MAG: HEPN domain-containing protein [Myxococcota bacterium]|nr:HEPN domain-containing protein [Myxococcota bacterium]